MRLRKIALVFLVGLAALAAPPEELSSVALPGANWAVRLDLTDFTKNRDDTRPDGKARIVRYAHADGRFNLTVRIVPIEAGHSLQLTAQDRLVELVAKPPVEIALEDATTAAIPSFRYYIDFDNSGKAVPQWHVHRFWRHGSYLVEIHPSVIATKASDAARLDALLGTVEVPQPATP